MAILRQTILTGKPAQLILSRTAGSTPALFASGYPCPHQSGSRSDRRQTRLCLRTPMLHRCQQLRIDPLTDNAFEVRELGTAPRTSASTIASRRSAGNYETVRFADHTNDPDPRKMLEHMRKAKPASSSDPV